VPVVRVTYGLSEVAGPTLEEVLSPIVDKAGDPR
jgi:hypothetical protein